MEIAPNCSLHNSSSDVSMGRNGSVCNTNNSSIGANSSWKLTEEVKMLLYVIYALIFLIGTAGNMVVFYFVGWSKKQHTSNDVFVLSLALADFVGSIFVPMVMISDIVSDFSEWYYGEIGCIILPSISPVTMAASSWMLVAIAVDRYRIIKSPFRARPNFWTVALILILLWGIALASTVKYTLSLKLIDGFCWDFHETSKDQLIVNLIFAITNWPIPLAIMVGIYTLSAHELKRGLIIHANNAAMRQRIIQNRKIVRMFEIIVVIFFLLTTPNTAFVVTFSVLKHFAPSKIDMSTMISVNYAVICITAANNCVNPLIYARMHHEIKRKLSGLLRSLHRGWSSKDGRESTSSLHFESGTVYFKKLSVTESRSFTLRNGLDNAGCRI